jgi:hypothetical protein
MVGYLLECYKKKFRCESHCGTFVYPIEPFVYLRRFLFPLAAKFNLTSSEKPVK